MSVFSYERYKIRIAPDSHKTQGLQQGDVVRRQYTDRNGNIYTLMAVIETGVDVIDSQDSPYFIGALLDGDAPRNGELLDFVRVTSLLNPDRSGALYLTASDEQAPYLDVTDGMATEQSLCYPGMDGGTADLPDKSKYACFGVEYVSVGYKSMETEALRVFRITRNDIALGAAGRFGLKQTIETTVEHPERLLVSFRIRASKTLSDIPIQFGYTDGERVDATDTVDAETMWRYRLWVVTVEYPGRYSRSLSLDLTGHLTASGAWCEIGDLNIVRLSSVAGLSGSTKSRIGKVSGIIDPVYGALEGYGAYFQRLYATRDVNIAGTLTAGDRNGFSSTFYVGKIHKNVVINSLACGFSGSTEISGTTPVGIGRAVRLPINSVMRVQTAGWREKHAGRQYCFSIWMKADEPCLVSVYQDEHFLQHVNITAGGEWQRHKVVFFIHSSVQAELKIRLTTERVVLSVTAPQLECGDTASPYQATDEILSYVEDYGAWLCRGGIGGTIQNPLLRLNEDGSISSCDGSFVINRDGTGHFASGRFKWTKDVIELRDFTIRWEDMDAATQQKVFPVYMNIESSKGSIFHNEFTSTVLRARIYRGNLEVTGEFNATDLRWTRHSNDAEGDKRWNAEERCGAELILDETDMEDSAVFKCHVYPLD